jgi:hypothetical protein
MRGRLRTFVLVAMIAAAAPSVSEEPGYPDPRSLDGQVQEIKSDVLGIATDLANLEERLLYPSSTEVAIFVSIESGDEFRLDAIKLEINGEPTTHYIYSFKELEALQKGGVQRLYTGNLPTGDHELTITVIGKLDNGKDFTNTESFSFAKEVKPKSIGLLLAGPGLGRTPIRLADW